MKRTNAIRHGDPQRVPKPPRDGLRRAKPGCVHAKLSSATGAPDRVCNVSGVMKRVAASVMTTLTSAPPFTSRRQSSAAL